jgi:thioredoxin 1
MTAVHLNKTDFDQKVAKGISLIDFWATWCGPCRMAGPVIDELAEKYKDKLLIGKVDVDKESELAEKYGVMSIPTVVLLKDGKEVDRVVGFVGEEGYKELIEKHLAS